MDESNPYAPPAAELFPVTTPPPLVFKTIPTRAGVYRDGQLLVMSKGDTLPDRCLKCNAPSDGWRIKRKLSWHPWGFYLLIFVHILVYIVVALIVRKTATVFVPLCPGHRRRRRRAIALGWTFCLLGPAVMIAGGAGFDSLKGVVQEGTATLIMVAAMFGGLAMFITGLVFAVIASRVAHPKQIDERYVWLKNVSPELLAALPPWVV